MAVVIRLSRVGTKSVPFFRVVVTDSRKKQGGKILENIGTYDAEKTKFVSFSPDRYDAWVKVGAQPSETAKKLYRLYKKNSPEASSPVVEVAEKSKAKKTTKKQAPETAVESAAENKA